MKLNGRYFKRSSRRNKFGGVLEIDVRDPEQEKFILKQKNRFNNKVFYDPYEDNYKYLVIQNGQVVFDEFKTIPEIKFPDFAASGPEKKNHHQMYSLQK